MKKFLSLTLIFFSIVSYGQIDLENGLIAFYPFNGNANDESGNENHGILLGPTLIEDRFGLSDKAFFFDGNDDYIKIEPVSDISSVQDFTLSLWAKGNSWESQPGIVPGINDKQYIFDGHSHSETSQRPEVEGFLITYTLTSEDVQQVRNTIYYSQYSIYTNKLQIQTELLSNWHNHVFIRKGATTYHYIDGILIETNNSSDLPLNMQHNLFIGTFAGNNPNYDNFNYNFHGSIDDIRIYDRALNEEEVLALFYEKDYNILTNSIDTLVNYDISIPVMTTYLSKDKNISAYQFDLSYDPAVLEYSGVDVTGSISENGTVNVNSSTPGLLKLSYMTSDTLSGEGELLFINFRTIGRGYSDIQVSDFLFNTDTVKNIINSTTTVAEMYGDVDGNNEVQAYDASLVLKNSVGLDPLPDSDPLPWESWRNFSADVDKSNDVTAMDASYILQYSTGSITEFPVYITKKSASADLLDIRIEERHINFYASKELAALNIFIDNLSELELGDPVVLNENFIQARNINNQNYNIGIATAYEPEPGEKILEIPYSANENVTLSLDLIVNTEYKNVSLDISSTTAISKYDAGNIQIFPNPVNSTFRIKGLKSNSEITVYSLAGRQLKYWKSISSEQVIDISDLKSGSYLLKVKNQQGEAFRKIIKR